MSTPAEKTDPILTAVLAMGELSTQEERHLDESVEKEAEMLRCMSEDELREYACHFVVQYRALQLSWKEESI